MASLAVVAVLLGARTLTAQTTESPLPTNRNVPTAQTAPAPPTKPTAERVRIDVDGIARLSSLQIVRGTPLALNRDSLKRLDDQSRDLGPRPVFAQTLQFTLRSKASVSPYIGFRNFFDGKDISRGGSWASGRHEFDTLVGVLTKPKRIGPGVFTLDLSHQWWNSPSETFCLTPGCTDAMAFTDAQYRLLKNTFGFTAFLKTNKGNRMSQSYVPYYTFTQRAFSTDFSVTGEAVIVNHKWYGRDGLLAARLTGEAGRQFGRVRIAGRYLHQKRLNGDRRLYEGGVASVIVSTRVPVPLSKK
ncbi:MAG: hypothetical protein ACKVPX_03135 [Myxococcaceae bacterium]